MKVEFLTKMLTTDTWVIIKDQRTKKTLFEGFANLARFDDKVKDWDFSKNHIIYV